MTEVVYPLATRLGWQPEVRLHRDLASGSFTIEPLHAFDLIPIAELVAKYHDMPLASVDASVVAAAERHGVQLTRGDWPVGRLGTRTWRTGQRR
jgi:hypothetical protein